MSAGTCRACDVPGHLGSCWNVAALSTAPCPVTIRSDAYAGVNGAVVTDRSSLPNPVEVAS